VVSLFAVFVLIAAFLYITSSSTLYTEFTAPFRKLVLSRSRQPLVVAILVVVPLLVGWRAWKSYQPDTAAPAAFRVIHPAPPGSITVHGKTIDLKIGQNPLRALEEDDPEAFAGHLAEGRRVYYENCYFCHGDELDGQGHFYRGLNPRPISFADKSTIAMFSETFLFWRIAKGGPGLPAAATPWDSAMPAWEDFLTNDEMWQVILYVYARTDQRPRAVSGEAR
jgi:mono/diheme cytochrome c family protein